MVWYIEMLMGNGDKRVHGVICQGEGGIIQIGRCRCENLRSSSHFRRVGSNASVYIFVVNSRYHPGISGSASASGSASCRNSQATIVGVTRGYWILSIGMGRCITAMAMIRHIIGIVLRVAVVVAVVIPTIVPLSLLSVILCAIPVIVVVCISAWNRGWCNVLIVEFTLDHAGRARIEGVVVVALGSAVIKKNSRAAESDRVELIVVIGSPA